MRRNVLMTCTVLFYACFCCEPAMAQWERLNMRAPRVVELIAATNVIVERWEIAANHWEQHLKDTPEDEWAQLCLARSLCELGRYDEAQKWAQTATESPGVAAAAFLELARLEAREGDLEAAATALAEAKERQLLVPSSVLSDDQALARLRSTEEYKSLLDDVENLRLRFRALADAENVEGLELLFHANSTQYWESVPTNLWLLHEIVDDYCEAALANDEERAATLAKRLAVGSKAADGASETEYYREWIEHVLAWEPREIKQRRAMWAKFLKLDSTIRSHRFGVVIDTCDQLARIAETLGDFPATLAILRARGLVHSAILDYQIPRRGVSRDTEHRLGLEAWAAHLQYGIELNDPKMIVDSYDFLVSVELAQPHMSLQETEPWIFGGIIATARLEPSLRELGMFEEMWRKLQERGR